MIAVVGTGAWGLNHVRAFARELVAICDLDARAREKALAIAPAAHGTADLDAILGNAAITGVVIATSAPTHADLACRVLAAGKHVLVEKPLALDVAGAERIARAAREAKRSVLVGHLMLYHPALPKLHEILRSGELGAVRYLHATRVNLGRLRRDESVLWSFGPHDLSMFDYLLGTSPIAVAAHGETYVQPGIEDVVHLELQFPDRVMANVRLSWLEPRKERRLTIVGSHKMIDFDDLAQNRLVVYDRGYDRPPTFTEFGEFLTIRHNQVRVPELVMDEPLRIMAQHFLEVCRGAVPKTDLTSGLAVVKTLAAAQQSLAAHGAWTPIDRA